MHLDIEKILSKVKNPHRYIGGEAGSRPKGWNDADVKVCLVFPDSYEIGTSHLGLSILYHILNDRPDMLAERAFTPWMDMEKVLSESGTKLYSLENKRPLSDFDIVGFSLAYELNYTNILTVLSLSGIPMRAKDRDESHPIVIAGGVCAYNPMPVAAFFDAIAIGDGEDLSLHIADIVKVFKQKGLSRTDILTELATVPGVFVPSIGEIGSVGRQVVANLDEALFPREPIVPYESTQMRVAVEVARGCARGCRFCQAGYIYRPVRHRSGAEAMDIASRALQFTGHGEFSFLSLSIGDWQPLETVLRGVHAKCGEMQVNASLPSLRAESMTDGIIETLGRARSGSFTLAPEAGTERMRRFINKGNTDDDLYASVEKIFERGWHAIKLYFMIGLPGETDEDVEGIIHIANKCLDIGRRYHKRPDVTVSTSVFIPKAHTPFQWEEQISIEHAMLLQRELKRKLRRPGLYYRWHDAKQSFLEGVFARGGAELADVIQAAHLGGARFDGWDECFDFDIWMKAFADTGIDPKAYLLPRSFDYEFPWEGLGVGPSKDFLIAERKKAEEFKFTPDCTAGECSKCGLCDFIEVKNRIQNEDENVVEGFESTNHESRVTSHGSYKYRFQYEKTGLASYLPAVETLDVLRLAFRAAGLPLRYTEGFHPRPRMASGPALSVGIESDAEFLDVEFTSKPEVKSAIEKIDQHLPDGMRIVEMRELASSDAAIDEAISSSEYVVGLDGAIDSIGGLVDDFLGADDSVMFTRVRGKRSKEVDLRPYVSELAILNDDMIRIGIDNIKPGLKPLEVVGAILNLDEEERRRVRIRKVAVEWKK